MVSHARNWTTGRSAAGTAYKIRGSGPPLLMVHGFPQTSAMWLPIAERFTATHTVILADLRGYGESAKPGQDHPQDCAAYSFRAMAADLFDLMQELGFARYHLVGHDRGARAAHRMALDAPGQIASVTLMDIVPTHLLLSDLTHSVAQSYFHWFFLAQPHPFPERLIASDPDYFFEACLLGWGGAQLDDFPVNQLAAYREAWRKPETIFGMCQDYRATLKHDLVTDTQDLGRQIECPALVLYGADGAMAQHYDIASTWAGRLADMRTATIPGGHFFPDTAPDATADALASFLQNCG